MLVFSEILTIGHVRYINILTWLRGSQVKLLSVGVAFFVSKSLLGIERQKKLKKFTIFTRKPRSHVRILIYRTWPIHNCKYMFLYKEKYFSSKKRLKELNNTSSHFGTLSVLLRASESRTYKTITAVTGFLPQKLQKRESLITVDIFVDPFLFLLRIADFYSLENIETKKLPAKPINYVLRRFVCTSKC